MPTEQAVIVVPGPLGESEAFERMLEPVLAQGYRLACGMLHDPQAAEDAVQEAALKAWRKQARLREGTTLRPWFLGIVANECRTMRRSRWWSVLKGDGVERSVGGATDSLLSGIELRKALRKMAMEKRLVLVLHWYLDLPLDEISVITGSSVHAVESRLQRGMAELRRRMEGRSAN